MSEVDTQKLLALLGLANRAGKLAVGFSAVEKMVRRGQRPLVILASDIGASQMSKVQRWDDGAGTVAGIMREAVSQEDLARALGREKLVVVGVSDIGFVKGIEKLKA
jgi:ribosomal protein L7Ae-like RNA K-turn-binding protein